MNKTIRGGYYSVYKFSFIIQEKWYKFVILSDSGEAISLYVEKKTNLFTIKYCWFLKYKILSC